MDQKRSIRHLMQALEQARFWIGSCAPNPSVGCVIAQGDRVLAMGAHRGPGSRHAETDAIAQLTHADLQDPWTVLYVTLEPCCHTGRTPPCTEAIIRSGIRRVIYAHDDPDTRVSGKSASILHASGVSCECIHVPEIEDFYRSYDHWHRYKKPYVRVKYACDSNMNWIKGAVQTGDALNQKTHHMRRQSDAILTTARTILLDRPSLDARIDGISWKKPIHIIDVRLSLLEHLPQIQCARERQWHVYHDASYVPPPHWTNQFFDQALALNFHPMRCSASMKIDWHDVMACIGSIGMHQIWVEVGPVAFSSLMSSQSAHELWIYVIHLSSAHHLRRLAYDFERLYHASSVFFEYLETENQGWIRLLIESVKA